MDPNFVEEEFKKWWKDSYGKPPGTHAVMTHVPFALHILQIKNQEMGEARREWVD